MTRKILTPVDLADIEGTELVIAAAVEQYQAIRDPELIIMTVVPEMIAGLDWRYAIRGETGGSEEWDVRKLLDVLVGKLNTVAAELVPDGIEFQTIARHGTVYEEVLEVADELNVDQIVVAAHRPGAADFLLGTNTARIVRHAKCSVTVVRRP